MISKNMFCLCVFETCVGFWLRIYGTAGLMEGRRGDKYSQLDSKVVLFGNMKSLKYTEP
jgi:hypothetical protein